MDIEKAKETIVLKAEDFVRYLPDKVKDDWEDDGTMPENVNTLKEAVIGRKIVSAEIGPHVSETRYLRNDSGLVLTLDDGRRVSLVDTDDCCAFTELTKFFLHPENVQHVITGVGTTDGFTKWHIYADFGDILDMDVRWSCGNPFYYGYGFDIAVSDAPVILQIDIPTV